MYQLFIDIILELELNNVKHVTTCVKENVSGPLGVMFRTLDEMLLWSSVHGLPDGTVAINFLGEIAVHFPEELSRLAGDKIIIAPCYPNRVRARFEKHESKTIIMGYWNEESCEILLWPKDYEYGLVMVVPSSQMNLLHTILHGVELEKYELTQKDIILIDTLSLEE